MEVFGIPPIPRRNPAQKLPILPKRGPWPSPSFRGRKTPRFPGERDAASPPRKHVPSPTTRRGRSIPAAHPSPLPASLPRRRAELTAFLTRSALNTSKAVFYRSKAKLKAYTASISSGITQKYSLWFFQGGIYMSIFDEIGDAIVFLRKRKGFTQEQLALECAISVSYLRRIEHGRANPTINELWRIAEVLEVELRNPFALPVAMGTLS